MHELIKRDKICSYVPIYLKINIDKLKNEQKIKEKIIKLSDYLSKRYEIKYDFIDYIHGYNGDDFENDQQTLRIRFFNI